MNENFDSEAYTLGYVCDGYNRIILDYMILDPANLSNAIYSFDLPSSIVLVATLIFWSFTFS